MKRFLTVLVTTLLLTAALCVTASASDFDAAAEDLSKIGMFQGTGSGFELDRAPTRSEAAIMLVRLYGAEDAAKTAYDAGEIKHPFTDVSAFASPYVAWLYTNGITNGTSATTFGSAKACSAQNYIVFLLRALGYQDNVDFQYADASLFAMTRGLLDTSLFGETFLRDDLAALTYQALACDLKDGSTYLLDSLVKSGAIDAEAAKPITEKVASYRALLSATANSMDSMCMDVDIGAKITADMAMTGVSEGTAINEKESMSMALDGNMKMILDSEDPQLAYNMTMDVQDATTQVTQKVQMWLKDGWMYIREGEDGYKVEVGEEMAAYQELLTQLSEQGTSQMSPAMLPFIDSITTKTSGGNTVYTLTLNDAMFGLVGRMVDTVLGSTGADLGMLMNMTLDDCAISYTIDRGGKLKACSVAMDMGMRMDMEDEEMGKMSISLTMKMDMTMDINAMGKDVRITYPDLSKFQDIESLYPEAEEYPEDSVLNLYKAMRH